jgi:hypothetical protein
MSPHDIRATRSDNPLLRPASEDEDVDMAPRTAHSPPIPQTPELACLQLLQLLLGTRQSGASRVAYRRLLAAADGARRRRQAASARDRRVHHPGIRARHRDSGTPSARLCRSVPDVALFRDIPSHTHTRSRHHPNSLTNQTDIMMRQATRSAVARSDSTTSALCLPMAGLVRLSRLEHDVSWVKT